jgi:hypothetical protein
LPEIAINPGDAGDQTVEKLIDEIGLSLHTACRQKLEEYVGERGFVMHHANHFA